MSTPVPDDVHSLFGDVRPGTALALAGRVTDEWSRWQQGQCGVYACALIQARPHLRLGTLNSSSHFFAHDDNYAYDSSGRHPLPYLGCDKDDPADEWASTCDLDENPADWYLPDDQVGHEGAGPNIEAALAHATRNGILEVIPGG